MWLPNPSIYFYLLCISLSWGAFLIWCSYINIQGRQDSLSASFSEKWSFLMENALERIELNITEHV